MPIADIIAIDVPVSVKSSHNITERGFSSNLSSHFSSRLPGDVVCWEPHLAASEVTILSTPVVSFAVSPPEDGKQRLTVRFAEPLDEERVDKFLTELATSLSVSMAERQKDGWHGILFTDIPLAEVKHERLAPSRGGITIGEAISMEVKSPQPLSVELLQELWSSPLAEIFVDGMKAPDTKAKFIYWFVMLEELERLDDFDALYKRLYEPADIESLVTNSGLTGAKRDRLKSWASGRNLTVQGRAEKLRLILHKIGAPNVDTISGTVAITAELCRSLIEQRNKVAHRGSQIDPTMLYTVLLPLAHRALTYLQQREQTVPASLEA